MRKTCVFGSRSIVIHFIIYNLAIILKGWLNIKWSIFKSNKISIVNLYDLLQVMREATNQSYFFFSPFPIFLKLLSLLSIFPLDSKNMRAFPYRPRLVETRYVNWIEQRQIDNLNTTGWTLNIMVSIEKFDVKHVFQNIAQFRPFC